MWNKDNICAISTSTGQSAAIALIRITGENSIDIVSKIFFPINSAKKLSDYKPRFNVLGNIIHDNQVIDEVVAVYYKAPNSYTGDDTVEISCHGSLFIQNEILRLLLSSGSRLAYPGEFTQRAFLNGKLNLAQAEAVGDLIGSETWSQHQIAINQIRGGFWKELKKLRTDLIDFAALIELELDFSEEDVEFAHRTKLIQLVEQLLDYIDRLSATFKNGNAIKKGIPVAIVGAPNVGKSTLLNCLLNEERAIVSDIAGTTRDTIEDTVVLDGLLFRFIDTAGLRKTDDVIESIGIERSIEAAKKARLIVYLFEQSIDEDLLQRLKDIVQENQSELLLVANKSDLYNYNSDVIKISAKNRIGVDTLVNRLTSTFKDMDYSSGHILTNLRHYEALNQAALSLRQVLVGIKSGVSSEFVAMDLRQALFHLGSVTGDVSVDDILDSIFSKFCIGK